MSKPYPFSSTRQSERAQRQGQHNVQVPVAGRHNTIMQTKSARAMKAATQS